MQLSGLYHSLLSIQQFSKYFSHSWLFLLLRPRAVTQNKTCVWINKNIRESPAEQMSRLSPKKLAKPKPVVNLLFSPPMKPSQPYPIFLQQMYMYMYICYMYICTCTKFLPGYKMSQKMFFSMIHFPFSAHSWCLWHLDLGFPLLVKFCMF